MSSGECPCHVCGKPAEQDDGTVYEGKEGLICVKCLVVKQRADYLCYKCGKPAMMEDGKVVRDSTGYKCKTCTSIEFKVMCRFTEIDTDECGRCGGDFDGYAHLDIEESRLLCGTCKKRVIAEMHGA